MSTSSAVLASDLVPLTVLAKRTENHGRSPLPDSEKYLPRLINFTGLKTEVNYSKEISADFPFKIKTETRSILASAKSLTGEKAKPVIQSEERVSFSGEFAP